MYNVYLVLSYLILVCLACFFINKYNNKIGYKTSFNINFFLISAILAAPIMVFTKTLSYTIATFNDSIIFFIGNSLTPLGWRNIFLFFHIISAIPCTFLGPLLFLDSFRKKSPNIHKLIGKFYTFGVFVSAIIILPLSTTNSGGMYPRICFTIMACVWFIFTLNLYRSAKNKNYIDHRKWALRSYALTFAFVHIEFTYKVIDIYNFFYDNPLLIKLFQSLFSWTINLIIVEIYIFMTTFKGKFIGKEMLYSKVYRLTKLNHATRN